MKYSQDHVEIIAASNALYYQKNHNNRKRENKISHSYRGILGAFRDFATNLRSSEPLKHF